MKMIKKNLNQLLKNTFHILTGMESQTRTRSGRIVKKPERYEPTEKVEDDYSSDEYDSDDPNGSEYSTDPEEEDDESEDDSEGSLKDFVVDSDSETEENDD